MTKKMAAFLKISGLSILFLLAGVGCGVASNNNVSQAKAKMASFLAGSNLKIDSAKYVDALGMYEFVINGNTLLYLDKSLKRVFVGDIIDVKTKENYTEKKVQQLGKVDFNQLPLDQAFKVVQGNGQVKIAVFSDPDCQFCKKLEKDLNKINNITVYNFLYPIDSLHPQARKKSVQIWCQKTDRDQVWVNYIREGKAIPKVAECVNPIKKNEILARKLRINGTPTIFLPDGSRLGGYVAYEEFKKILDRYRK